MLAYHTSNTKFDKFSLNNANTRKVKEKFNALWFSTDKEYVKDFGKILYTVDIDTKNFLKETQYRKIDKLCMEFGLDEEEDGYGIGIIETDRGQEFVDFLVSKGVDGYMFKQHNGYTLIVFNPECVTIKNITSLNDKLDERLEELTTGIYATNSPYDVINFMKNKPKAYRIIYDSNINYYFIGDAFNYIHIDLLEEAYKQAFYPDKFAVDEMRDYMDDEMYNDTLLLFSFYPNEGKKLDIEKSSDGYTRKYVYDFGNIYAHEMTPLEHSDIYSILGKPLKREDIFEDKIDFRRLNKQLDQILEMSPNYPRKQTGLPVLIYVSAKEGSHGPRIKFLNRLNSSWRGSKDPDSVSISICDNPKIVYPKTGVRLRISTKEFNQVKSWIIQNKDVLLDFWNGVISTKEELDSKLTKLNLNIS